MQLSRRILFRLHRGEAPPEGRICEADDGEGRGAGHGVR